MSNFNWEQIKKKGKELYDEGSRKIKQYTPESFSKEKKFVNALVISLALLTMADEKAETEEVVASLDILKDIQEIQDLDMVQDSVELYELHIGVLEDAVGKTTKWTITIAKLLSEVSKIKEYPEYVTMVQNLLDYMAAVDGEVDDKEKDMIKKILKALT